MKNKKLEKYHNKQLNSETPYGLKPYQVLMIAIITLLVCLFIVLPGFILEKDGLDVDYETTMFAVFIFIIFILFPPFLLIFIGNFIQKLIHQIFRTKYHIHMFPLFLIFFCSAIFIATISIVIKDFCNQVHDPETPIVIMIAIGFLLYALFLSGKVVTKYGEKSNRQNIKEGNLKCK